MAIACLQLVTFLPEPTDSSSAALHPVQRAPLLHWPSLAYWAPAHRGGGGARARDMPLGPASRWAGTSAQPAPAAGVLVDVTDLGRAFQDLAAASHSGCAFLLAFGSTWLVCGVVAFRFSQRTAALCVLFQGVVALPLAFLLQRLLGLPPAAPEWARSRGP